MTSINRFSWSQIKDLRNVAHHADTESRQNEDYKRRVRQLEEELNGVRARLQIAEQEANAPSPLLLQLQEEMEKMKVSASKNSGS